MLPLLRMDYFKMLQTLITGISLSKLTLRVNPNWLWCSYNWCLFSFMGKLYNYYAFKFPDKFVWNMYNFAWNIFD